MPKKKTEDGIVAHTESDERLNKPAETGDKALDEVLSEDSAGATDTSMDIETTIGEDKFASEIEAEASAVEETEEPKEEVAPEAEKPAKKGAKKAHVQGERKPLHGKKYRNALQDVDLTKSYSKDEALALVKKTSTVNFDATVEAHIKLSIDNVRATVTLPAGTGKSRKVATVTSATLDDFIKQVESGKLDFDIVIATPDVMSKLSKVARVLGPRGLMPNPKSGTVTNDIEKAQQEFAGGRVEYKQDKGKVVHLGIGKVSMTEEQLKSNLDALLATMTLSKITSVSLSSTMGPGIKVSL